MNKSLPDRPNLEHLKKQAKDLLSSFRKGDDLSRNRFAEHLPSFERKLVSAPDDDPIALHDAQSVVAREYGFPSWAQLRSSALEQPLRLPFGDPVVWIAHETHVPDVRFSPDGDYLLSTGMKDPVVKLWRVGSWEHVRTLEAHTKCVNQISFSPDGERMATGSTDGVSKIWSWPDLELIEEKPKVGASTTFSPAGDRMVTIGPDWKMRLWSHPGYGLIKELKGHVKRAHTKAFSPDGKLLATGGLDNEIIVWSTVDGELLHRFDAHQTATGCLAFSEDGRWLYSVGFEGRIKRWRASDWSCDWDQPIAERGTGAYSMAISPDNSLIAITIDHGIQLRRESTGVLVDEIELPPKGCYSLSFSPKGEWLAMSAADKRVRVWPVG